MNKINNFCNNLEKVRIEKGISQEELAFLIGVSRQTIYKWEAEICNPTLDKVIRLVNVLKVNIEDLIF